MNRHATRLSIHRPQARRDPDGDAVTERTDVMPRVNRLPPAAIFQTRNFQALNFQALTYTI
jgi:hypothetical protein